MDKKYDHDANWSKRGVKKRVVHMILHPNEEQLKQLRALRQDKHKALVYMNRKFFYNRKKNPNLYIDEKYKTLQSKSSGTLMEHDFATYLNKCGFLESCQKRSLTFYLIERYAGIDTRHGKAQRPIRLDPSKGVLFKAGETKIKDYVITKDENGVVTGGNGILSIKLNRPNPKSNGKQHKVSLLDIPFSIIDKFANINPTDSEGYMVDIMSRYKPTYRPCIDINIDWLYKPKIFLGIDINKTDNTFLYANYPIFQNSLVLTRSKEIKTYVDTIRDLNQQIDKSKCIDTKETRKLRIQWKQKHDEFEKHILTNIINPIINWAMNNEACVCIDMSNTGGKNGTYGQDKVISLLIRECENRSIPFVKTPTYYTSSRCPNCGTFYNDGKSVKAKGLVPPNFKLQGVGRQKELFICPDCTTLNSDYIGALNIAYFGEMLWTVGSEIYDKWLNDELSNKIWVPNTAQVNDF